MKLHVDFDEELMSRYHRRGASPFFTIYWTHSQEAYPNEDWLDFGSVIIGWWLIAATSLLHGALEEEFLFMDGPYALAVRPFGNQYHISMQGRSELWKVERTSFMNELLSAANQTVAKLNELQIPDKEGLQIGIRELKIALSEQKARANTAPTVKPYAHR